MKPAGHVAVGADQRLQKRLGLGQLVAAHQKRRQSLARLRVVLVQLQPQARGFQRLALEPAVGGDLGRALGQARIARLLGHIEVALGGKLQVAALGSDLRQQELEQQILIQLVVGQRATERLAAQDRARPILQGSAIPVIVRLRQGAIRLHRYRPVGGCRLGHGQRERSAGHRMLSAPAESEQRPSSR